MKRILLLLSFVAALVLCASAQTYIDFHEMPIAKAPAPMPDLYPEGVNLYWDNFYYVTPGIWKGEGPGFWVDPSTKHNTVALVGGPLCNLAIVCAGSIKMNPAQVGPTAQTFTPVSITLTAGWLPNNVIVTAYSNSKFVGSTIWKLTTEPQTFTFPNTWTRVTQLVFTPEFIHTNAIYPKAGSMVIYNFILVKH
jgi:hypothetical protein